MFNIGLTFIIIGFILDVASITTGIIIIKNSPKQGNGKNVLLSARKLHILIVLNIFLIIGIVLNYFGADMIHS